MLCMNKTIFPRNDRVNVSNISPSDQIDSGRKKKMRECQRQALENLQRKEAANFELRVPRI